MMCLRRVRTMLEVGLLPTLAVAAMLAVAAAEPARIPVAKADPPAGKEKQQETETNRQPGCRHGGLYPVCRRVPLTKKKPQVEYSMKCEPVCVPGCSLLSGCRDNCSCTTTRVREKKMLLKKITEQEVTSYEYKIFWVCRSCAFGGGCCGPTNR
jgi:hypothetical protein